MHGVEGVNEYDHHEGKRRFVRHEEMLSNHKIGEDVATIPPCDLLLT
jgi:hypothetical protein